MKGRSTRGRSDTNDTTTSDQTRPVSRASTTSLNTPKEPLAHTFQPTLHAAHTTQAPDMIQGAGQYVSDDIFARSRRQFSQPYEQRVIDPSLQQQNGRRNDSTPRETSTDLAQENLQDTILQRISRLQSFQDKRNDSFTSVNDGSQDESAPGNPKKKKSSASSIANDQELRRLYQENKERTLRDVADSVLQEERGPKSEKTKQIFAMIWLSTVCRKGSNSVPRNRVFSYYATRCGNERVPPLNPASFGKLVRIIFPGIQTRRLGMRGESKYHYVNLEMVEDAPECRTNRANSHPESHYGGTNDIAIFPQQRAHLPADTAVFPPPGLLTNRNSMIQNREIPGAVSKGNIYLSPHVPTAQGGHNLHDMASRHLKFPSTRGFYEYDQQEIELPSLHGYMPAGTDSDAADALRALYRTHCIAVIDGFRYCKEKTFYHAFTSFHGTLTVPVQKLLAYPGLAPWIKECDWLMYQKMIRFVAPLALQAMPVRVIDTFRTVAQRLGPHILNTFQHHPAHVRDARHGPAMIFSSLLDRLLRVNATAHAAANILTDSTSRNQMWYDWVYCVRPTTVVETSLPGYGYTRTMQILTNEIRELLGPLQCVKYDGMQPIFAAVADDHEAEIAHQMQDQLDSSSTESVLDRWNNFLTNLPSRFPHADARTLIHCVGAVASAALRDITMADAKSFGYWCVTKTWVEEMLQWLAEKGGFLESTPDTMVMRPKKRTAESAGFDIDEAADRAYLRPWTSYSEAGRRDNKHESPVTRTQSMDNVQNNSQFQQSNADFRRNEDPQSQSLNNGSNINPNRYLDSHSQISQHTQYGPVGHQGNYNERMSPQRITYAQQQQQQQQFRDQAPSHSTKSMDKAAPPMIPPHLAEEAETARDNNNDDSGIGLDLELPTPQHHQQQPSQRSPLKVDYNAFMNTTGTASDPADVVVC